MTASLPNTRLLAVLGALAALVGILLIARPLVMGDDDSAAPAATPQPITRSTPPPAPAAAPRVNLLPGVPAAIAQKLRYSNVVVVSLYGAKAPGDRKALAHARVGARQTGAGFLAFNVFDERKANALVKYLGNADSPAVLIVRRPGTVVTKIDGFVDAAIVAQAAQNAGAHKKSEKSKQS
jgi:hypothetical protein